MDTLIGFISVAVAVAALWLETKRSRLSMQADMLMRLDEKFTDNSVRNLRKAASKKLLADETNIVELCEVLNFFTNISYMVNHQALDQRLAYDGFEYWISRYWQAALASIQRERNFDPDSWGNLEKLVRKFERIKSKKKQTIVYSKEELNRFLVEETQLLIKA